MRSRRTSIRKRRRTRPTEERARKTWEKLTLGMNVIHLLKAQVKKMRKLQPLLSIGFTNPGSLGDRLPRQGSAQENIMLFMGLPEGPKTRRARWTVRSPTGRSAQKNERPLINFFSPPSTGVLAPGTSHLRAASPIGRPDPKRCFLLRPRVSDRGPVGSLLAALL